MDELFLFLVFPFVVAVVMGIIIIPKVVLISKRKRLFDSINNRKVHARLISRLGGVSYFPAIIVSVSSTIILYAQLSENVQGIGELNIPISQFMSFILGFTMVYFLGVADDFIGVRYHYKMLVQSIAVFAVIGSSLYIASFDGLFGIYEINFVVSLILTWMLYLGTMNAINLIDGVDGLCSSMALLVGIPMCWWFFINDLFGYTIICSAFVGICAIFLRFNLSKGKLKLFMGDTGSLIIGYILGFIALNFITINQRGTIPYPMEDAIVVAFSLVFVPVMDSLRVYAGRIHRKTSPFLPDKTHIHHLLLNKGYSHKECTAIIVAIAAVIIALTCLFSIFLSTTTLFFALMCYGMAIIYFVPLHFPIKRMVPVPQKKSARKRKFVF